MEQSKEKRREKKHDGANSQAESPSTSAPTATTPQQMLQNYGLHQVVYQHHPRGFKMLNDLPSLRADQQQRQQEAMVMHRQQQQPVHHVQQQVPSAPHPHPQQEQQQPRIGVHQQPQQTQYIQHHPQKQQHRVVVEQPVQAAHGGKQPKMLVLQDDHKIIAKQPRWQIVNGQLVRIMPLQHAINHKGSPDSQAPISSGDDQLVKLPASSASSVPPVSTPTSKAATSEEPRSETAVKRESDRGNAKKTLERTSEERKRKVNCNKIDDMDHSESGKALNESSQTSMRSGETNAEAEPSSTLTSQQGQQSSSSSTTDGRKRRKITRMVREPDGPPDPTEVLIDNLCEHLGIPQNRDFNVDVSLAKKQEAGRRLKELLEVVSDGALVPLMHVTLNDTNVKKLAELKGAIIPLLAEKLSLNDDRSFHVLNQNEQTNAGNQLRDLVRGVAGEAIVPLMNATLSRDEVKKLCCLKGIQGSDLETEDADEDTDVDENMALADRDIQAQNAVQGNINLETDQTNKNHLSECNDPPIASIKGGDTNPKTNQNSDEGRQTQGSSSRTDADGSTINRAQREPALRRDLMKLGVNLQKQIMDFICEKCD